MLVGIVRPTERSGSQLDLQQASHSIDAGPGSPMLSLAAQKSEITVATCAI